MRVKIYCARYLYVLFIIVVSSAVSSGCDEDETDDILDGGDNDWGTVTYSLTMPDLPPEVFQDVASAGPDPAVRSAFYESVMTRLKSGNDECVGSNLLTDYDSLRPVCVNLFLESYAKQFPDLAEVIEIGESSSNAECSDEFRVKHSTCKTPIKAIRLTNKKASTPLQDRPSALFVAGLHGFEKPPQRIVLDWIDFLLSRPNARAYAMATANRSQIRATNWRNKDLLDNFNIWIVPLANPHSYERAGGSAYTYTVSGVDANLGKTTANLVNPEKDWPNNWSLDNIPTPVIPPATKSKWTGYSGNTPLSQPETRAISGLLETIVPVVFVNMHGHRNGLDDAGVTTCDLWDTTTNSRTSVNGDFANNDTITEFHWAVTFTFGTNPDRDALQFVYRGMVDDRTDIDDELFNSIPFLAEQNARLNPCSIHNTANCPPPMYYSPYSEHRFCYDSTIFPVRRRGTGSGPNQFNGYAASAGSGLSMMFEVPMGYWERDPSHRWNRTKSGTGLDGSIWYSDQGETLFRKVAADNFYPLNRLVALAANPQPKAHPAAQTANWFPSGSASPITPRHTLAITGFAETTMDGCDLSYTFWPEKGSTCCDPNVPGDDNRQFTDPDFKRNGYYGERKISCSVSNWGNEAHSNPFFIRMKVKNLTTSSVVRRKKCDVTSMEAPSEPHRADTVTCTTPIVQFDEGDEYQISCELVQGLKSAPGFKLGDHDASGSPILNPIGQSQNAGWEDINAEECTATAGTNAFPACHGTHNIWKMGYFKQKTFKAVIDQSTVCRGAERLKNAQNINGRMIGHIPATTI